MGRIGLALRILFQGNVARQVAAFLEREKVNGPAQPATKIEPTPTPKAAKSVRSDAVTLLATLQREARFIDFIKEPLDGFADAQVGAAARDVHRECAKVLDRLFAIGPLLHQDDGSPIDVPAGFDSGRYRLTGKVVGDPPFHGSLVHHGWEATVCQLPSWSGSELCAQVVAPAEVELK